MKKVCFFGIYDPKHWRVKSLKRSFESIGYQIFECRIDPREVKGLKKYIELSRRFKSLEENFDYVVVGFPGYGSAIVARLITTSPIIFDAYISYFDGIRDRRDYRLINPRMWLAWLVDVVSCTCANTVLTINGIYKNFFVDSLLVPERKVEVVHKGADEAVFYPRPNPTKSSQVLVGWWGSFIPLHGLPVIIDTANLLRDEGLIQFEIIGRGQLMSEIKKRSDTYALQNLKFTSYIPQADLVERISEFDIVLGIFAATPKSGRCVTNKVYEAMAMGKAIITQDSVANREIFTHLTDAYLVPPGDHQSLAEAIRKLASDEGLRHKLGQGARDLFKTRFTLEKIEEELSGIIERHHVSH
ncbi:MAG: glycosyltransferase [Minisyncoccota bacterium]